MKTFFFFFFSRKKKSRAVGKWQTAASFLSTPNAAQPQTLWVLAEANALAKAEKAVVKLRGLRSCRNHQLWACFHWDRVGNKEGEQPVQWPSSAVPRPAPGTDAPERTSARTSESQCCFHIWFGSCKPRVICREIPGPLEPSWGLYSVTESKM